MEHVKHVQIIRDLKMAIQDVVKICVQKISSFCMMEHVELAEMDLSLQKIVWTVLKLRVVKVK